jgi:hypothetical protein
MMLGSSVREAFRGGIVVSSPVMPSRWARLAMHQRQVSRRTSPRMHSHQARAAAVRAARNDAAGASYIQLVPHSLSHRTSIEFPSQFLRIMAG